MLKRNKMQENKIKGQPKGQKLPKGLSEGTYSEGTKIRRDLFRRDRKKREKKIIARQHKLNREKREKFFDNSRELLVCEIVRNESYIYR